MFENIGEIVVLGLAVMVAWMTAWTLAARRTVGTIAASYEIEASRARRRVAELEAQLGERQLRPHTRVPSGEGTVTVVDPSYAATA